MAWLFTNVPPLFQLWNSRLAGCCCVLLLNIYRCVTVRRFRVGPQVGPTKREACKSGIARHCNDQCLGRCQPRDPHRAFLHSFRTHPHFQSKMTSGIEKPRNPHKTNVPRSFVIATFRQVSRSKRVNSSPLPGLSLPPRRPHLNGTFRHHGENM
jgi:hypothetical protein